jgi:hypothetical protein
VSGGRQRIVMVLSVIAVLLLLVLVFRPTTSSPGRNSSAVTSNGPYHAYQYTCCTASIMNAIYHPGEVVTVHWIRSAPISTGSSATPITLSITLSGPYRTVKLLKTDSVGPHPRLGRTRATAVPVRVMDSAADSPVSTLRIPENARSGYYNLTTTTGTKNLTVSGSGVIRID